MLCTNRRVSLDSGIMQIRSRQLRCSVELSGMTKSAFVSAALCFAFSCATTTQRENLPPLQTVAKVDLSRYLGTWHKIASFPQSFQKGCTRSTANYSLLPDGEIEVVNKCNIDSVTGPEKTAKGRARVIDTASNAKLEVSFFRPFWGDYWIVDLGADYEYAVVGHPGRDYLWILSRAPTLSATQYDDILARLKAMHYDTSKLKKTEQ